MKPLIVFLLLSIAVYSCSEKEAPYQEITPPFKNVQVPSKKMEVDASEDKVILLENGSSINVPKNAFVDKNGKPVTGKIQLEYREFHNAADIIASGIPMTYQDEKGEVRQMESGGMFEINGKVNGQDVFISKDKSLNVNMASKIPGDFDFYYLEEEGKPKQAEAGLAFISEAYGQSEGSPKKKARWIKLTNKVDNPAIEEKEDPNAVYFPLQFDTVKFPETKLLKGIKWQLAKEGERMNPLDTQNQWVSQEKWEIAELDQPKNFSLLNKEVPVRKDKGLFYFAFNLIDSTRVLVWNEHIQFYDFKGNPTATFSDTSIIDIEAYSLESNRLITTSRKDKSILWTTDGKKVKVLDTIRDGDFFNKGTRLVYKTTGEGLTQLIKVTDVNGKLLNEIKLTFNKSNFSYSPFYSWVASPDKHYFATSSKEGVRIYNGDGKLLKSTPSTDQDYDDGIVFVRHMNSLAIQSKEGKLKLWDWQADKMYSPPIEILPNSIYNMGHSFHPKEPVMVINSNEGFFQLWNWKTNSLKKIAIIDDRSNAYFHNQGPLLFSHGYGVEGQVWNEEGKFIGTTKGKPNYSKDYKSLILILNNGLEWRDSKGNLIRDFRSYDSTIQQGVFRGNDEVVTVSGSGVVNVWDKKGNVMNTFKIDLDSKYVMFAFQNYLYTLSRSSIAKAWDYQGNLVSNMGSINWISLGTADEKLMVTYQKDKARFWEITSDTLPADVSMLGLKSGQKTFSTYVKLTRGALSKFREYKSLKNEMLVAENERAQKEDALIRSFQIKNFGVYNWDRFYKEEGMIAVDAEFDFGVSTNGYANITVFLITGKEQNTVIKYYKEVWSKFKFDPKVPNQLIAVLPDDQIAVFDQKEFAKLNVEEMKKSGKYSFKMKVLGKVESVDALNKLLKAPV